MLTLNIRLKIKHKQIFFLCMIILILKAVFNFRRWLLKVAGAGSEGYLALVSSSCTSVIKGENISFYFLILYPNNTKFHV